MITADFAISRFRRDLTLTAAVKGLLVGGALACVFFLKGVDHAFVITAFLAVWLTLSFKSAQGSRLVADSPTLISLGRFDEAEASLDQAFRTFSMFRTVKLLSLHHLATLRYKQKQWGESAKLCRALLKQRLGGLANLTKPSQLMLADALLQMGDLRGAYESIRGLYNHRLSLAEAMQLMVLQLDYETRIAAWSSATAAIRQKVEMCELLPARESARAQAMLALAAKNAGQMEWSTWLVARARLLGDINDLVARQPILKELFPDDLPAA
ncbi:hypothetical protein BH10PLA1_BH10PLA1_04150 [soil metagenome]